MCACEVALSPSGVDKWVGRGVWFGHLVRFWLVYLLKLIANYLFSLCRL